MFFVDGDSEYEFHDGNLILNKWEEESEIMSERTLQCYVFPDPTQLCLSSHQYYSGNSVRITWYEKGE